MDTGEDKQGLRKIIDLTRMISIAVLSIHCYLACYLAFALWGLTHDFIDRIMTNLVKLEIFFGMLKPKLAALVCLLISLFGAKGKKDEKAKRRHLFLYLASGLLVYSLSFLVLYFQGSYTMVAALYIGLTTTGYLLILAGGTRLSRLIQVNLNKVS